MGPYRAIAREPHRAARAIPRYLVDAVAAGAVAMVVIARGFPLLGGWAAFGVFVASAALRPRASRWLARTQSASLALPALQAGTDERLVARCVPECLGAWSLDSVRVLAAGEHRETDRVAFALDLGTSAERERVRRTATAFANTRGGFVVFGVTAAGEVFGTADRGVMAGLFEQLVRDGVAPSIECAFGAAMPIGYGRSAFVVEIRVGARGAHAVLEHGHGHWHFYRRTEAGANVPMGHGEIVAAMTEHARRDGEIERLAREVERVGSVARRLMKARMAAEEWYWDRFEPAALRTQLAITEAWIGDAAATESVRRIVDRCAVADRVLERIRSRQEERDGAASRRERWIAVYEAVGIEAEAEWVVRWVRKGAA